MRNPKTVDGGPVIGKPARRRTMAELDAEAQRVLDEWADAERAAGRDPDRWGWLAEIMDSDPKWRSNPVVMAWWRVHLAAQRYG